MRGAAGDVISEYDVGADDVGADDASTSLPSDLSPAQGRQAERLNA